VVSNNLNKYTGTADTGRAFPFSLAYVVRHAYPDLSAAAGQSIQMAAALAKQVLDAEFYVHDLDLPEDWIRAQYPGVVDSPLRIRSVRMSHLLPRRSKMERARFIIYNSIVTLNLMQHQLWKWSEPRQNILFVRSRLELVYWGLIRRYVPGFKKWIFINEVHDVAGLRPEAANEQNPFDLYGGSEGRRRQRTRRALSNFDLVLSVTQALADDLRCWSNDVLQPEVVRHASGLNRLSQPPETRPYGDRIILGYVGTIDEVRGVDTLISGMRHLSGKFLLRLVGRVLGQTADGQGLAWLDELLSDPEIGPKVELIPPVPVSRVEEEIDRCDILLLPASDDIISWRYRAPLKLFDYMVRGKPIIAADVPCHRELLDDGINALLYRHKDAQHLVARIESLTNQPRRAHAIARAAWEQAADYTYDARAQRILELAERVHGRR